jgi:hypothetical protein
MLNPNSCLLSYFTKHRKAHAGSAGNADNGERQTPKGEHANLSAIARSLKANMLTSLAAAEGLAKEEGAQEKIWIEGNRLRQGKQRIF